MYVFNFLPFFVSGLIYAKSNKGKGRVSDDSNDSSDSNSQESKKGINKHSKNNDTKGKSAGVRNDDKNKNDINKKPKNNNYNKGKSAGVRNDDKNKLETPIIDPSNENQVNPIDLTQGENEIGNQEKPSDIINDDQKDEVGRFGNVGEDFAKERENQAKPRDLGNSINDDKNRVHHYNHHERKGEGRHRDIHLDDHFHPEHEESDSYVLVHKHSNHKRNRHHG